MADPNGPSIEALRISKGVKRSALAKQVGCTYPAIYNIERGFKGASIELLQLIATALGVELSAVVAAKPRPAPTTSPQPSRPVAPPRETKPPTRTAA